MGILAGPILLLRAFGVLARFPRLIKLALVPALVTLGVSVVAVWATTTWGDALLARLWAAPESGAWSVVWWIVDLLAKVASVVLVLLITPWLVMLVGLPLCEPLAGALDERLAGRAPEGGSLIGDMAAALKGSLGVLAIGLAGAVVFFALGLVPALGALTVPFVLFIWTPLFLALDLYDAPLGRRRLGLRAKLAVLRGNLLGAVSLGLCATPLVATPVLNLLGLPLAVVAGVLAVNDLQRAGRLPAMAR